MSKLVCNRGETDLNFTKTQLLINGGLGFENFRGRVITGRTNATPDTQQLFKHQLTPRPFGGVVLLGNAYVAFVDDNYADVRSPQASTLFTVFLVNEKLGS